MQKYLTLASSHSGSTANDVKIFHPSRNQTIYANRNINLIPACFSYNVFLLVIKQFAETSSLKYDSL